MDNEHFGSSFFMLPFIERSSEYEAIKSWLTNEPDVNAHKPPFIHRAGAGVGFVSTFCCPSDANSRTNAHYITGGIQGRTNIVTCRGDVLGRNEFSGTGASAPTHADHNTYVEGTKRGFFVPFVFRNMADITDGLSNTICISESVTTETETGDRNIRGGIITNFSGTGYVWNGNASACFNARTGNMLNRGSVGQYGPAYRGNRIFDGRVHMDGFATVMPPNSPSCHASTSYNPGWSTLSANSNHSGGVTVGRVDGSVTFVSETVDAGNVNANQVTSPGTESPYGVWGALGSINGGESKSL